MAKDIRRSFRSLFEDSAFSIVEVPIIQRDYAQGRMSAKEVRAQFLQSLYNTLHLPADSTDIPLDLDFVYGNVEGERKAFCPLDGQQRLTTLFLLHWYLACKDNKSDEFQAFIRVGSQSRFTYEIRPSSKEFFDALVNTNIDIATVLTNSPQELKNQLSKLISEKSWFFLSWKQDPTIQSALEMIDDIHDLFCKTDGLYERLVNIDKPYITFQFLNLHDFGLSDDLYIKMNARGKPLTNFEAFKARLEQRIGDISKDKTKEMNERVVSLREYFSHKVDTSWSDLFWSARVSSYHSYDLLFMNFIRAVTLVANTGDPNGRSDSLVNRIIDDLISYEIEYTFYTYQKDNLFTSEFVDTLIALLDCLSLPEGGVATYLSNSKYYDEKDLFRRIINGGRRSVIQSEWVQFFGYCRYIVKNSPGKNSDGFYDWVRVISNLASNTVFYHTDDLRRAFSGVQELLIAIGTGSVLEYLSDNSKPLSGFNRQQIREEQLKAQLMLKNTKWCDPILQAENHGYFKGQIEFILKFCGVLDRYLEDGNCNWNDADDEQYRQAFIVYLKKASAIFDTKGLRDFDDYLLERALLSIGDYLLEKGRNLSFLDNSDRDASWKRLLRGSDQTYDKRINEKRQLVKLLFDRLDADKVKESLTQVIDDFLPTSAINPEDLWRKKIVECPDAIGQCKKKQIRMINSNLIYLLSKQQMNGNHAELGTYHIWRCHLIPKEKRRELVPFVLDNYHLINNDIDLPFIRMRIAATKLFLEIQQRDGVYVMHLYAPTEQLPLQFEEGLRVLITCEPGQPGQIIIRASEGSVVDTLEGVIKYARGFDWGSN